MNIEMQQQNILLLLLTMYSKITFPTTFLHHLYSCLERTTSSDVNYTFYVTKIASLI